MQGVCAVVEGLGCASVDVCFATHTVLLEFGHLVHLVIQLGLRFGNHVEANFVCDVVGEAKSFMNRPG